MTISKACGDIDVNDNEAQSHIITYDVTGREELNDRCHSRHDREQRNIRQMHLSKVKHCVESDGLPPSNTKSPKNCLSSVDEVRNNDTMFCQVHQCEVRWESIINPSTRMHGRN